MEANQKPMRTDTLPLAFDYLRLSDEEANAGESSSITNQRNLIMDYLRQKPEFDCANYIEYCDM